MFYSVARLPSSSRSLVLGLVLASLSGFWGLSAVVAATPTKLALPQPSAGSPSNSNDAPAVSLPFPTVETAAKFALLVDYETGAVLLDKQGSERLYPSSMTKMMTAYLVLDRLQRGSLKLSDKIMVSANAWRKGGAMTDSSTMFLPPDQPATVEDLIQGVIVQSGNDASIALAEGLSGSEEAFVAEMNNKAAEFGMKDTHFSNVTGIPDKLHYSTARDLAILSWHSIHDHPNHYHYYRQKFFAYNRHEQQNRNLMLFDDGLGVDGLKTGHTEISGYGIAATALRNGRRLILVINGLPTMQLRAAEAKKLLGWGYAQFDNYPIAGIEDRVGTAEVWKGRNPTVGLVPLRPILVTLPRLSHDHMRMEIIYQAPLLAPITAGTEVATLKVTAPGVDELTFPLTVAEPVLQQNWFKRIGSDLAELFRRATSALVSRVKATKASPTEPSQPAR